MKRVFLFIIVFLFGIIPLLDLLHPGLPQGHDTQDHVARIANFYQNLSEGTLIPRWAGNLNWGYGHPILMFLYPLPSYTTSLIHFFGFSFVDSVKIFFGLAFIASGLAMYLWLKQFLSREASLVGAILYLYAPYRFVDLYVRGAIGEHAAFVFPPLVLYFLFKLSKKYSYWYLVGGALSLAGLILAHNAISLMFLPIILLYAAYLIWQSKKIALPAGRQVIAHCLLLICFGFALSAFFWMPAFMEGKYTLRDIVTEGSVNDRFSSPMQLLYGPWSYGGTGQLSVQVGLIQWLFVIISIPLLVVLWSKNKKKPIFLLCSLLVFFFTLFLITPYSQLVWESISTLQKFQFPWRFLSLSTFLAAVIGAIVFGKIYDLGLKTKDSKSKAHGVLHLTSYILHPKIILIIFIVAILFVNKDYWHAKGYLQKPESFYTGIYDSTTDTGESAPIWSVRFMEKRPEAHIEVISAEAQKRNVQINELGRTSTMHMYTVIANEKIRLRENTLYFPGWKVLVDGVEVPVEFQDTKNRGLMTFFVDKGKHEVIVKFEETKLRMTANSLSLVSLLVLVGLGIIMLRKRN